LRKRPETAGGAQAATLTHGLPWQFRQASLERASILIPMYSHELDDFTGSPKKKTKKPGAKKRRSYRKPIGQNYRKSGDFVVTTQLAQSPQPVDFANWRSWDSWSVVTFSFFCCGILYTFIA
jgi:hypothetical protein